MPCHQLSNVLVTCELYTFNAGSWEQLQVPTFRNSTYLDPQVGLTKNLGVRQ